MRLQFFSSWLFDPDELKITMKMSSLLKSRIIDHELCVCEYGLWLSFSMLTLIMMCWNVVINSKSLALSVHIAALSWDHRPLQQRERTPSTATAMISRWTTKILRNYIEYRHCTFASNSILDHSIRRLYFPWISLSFTSVYVINCGVQWVRIFKKVIYLIIYLFMQRIQVVPSLAPSKKQTNSTSYSKCLWDVVKEAFARDLYSTFFWQCG
jgi:hypothetical protein